MTATTPDRYKHSRAILGPELFQKVQEAKLLVVGAGGIGCELVKNLVMTGFSTSSSPTSSAKIVLLDLDTIDLSNLNRQFLFQKQHVKRPKAVVARETALKFNPEVRIEALHRNIKDSDFPPSYFTQFSLVLNALDNLDARRHVNRMCLAAGVPLIESGTSGYVGQVQPIFQKRGKEGGEAEGEEVECFDCTGKPVPKTFAVCTIRSTPSTAHHCIAWAKSYLLPQLFGEDSEQQEEEERRELDEAEKGGENADEIANLRAETAAVRQLRATLSVDPEGAAKRVFEKVYQADIERLLKMEDMWAHRRPPVPLSWKVLSQQASSSSSSSSDDATAATEAEKAAPEKKDEARIKDQRKLEVKDSFALFCDGVKRLCLRAASSLGSASEAIEFDKDDPDTLDFVVGAANLRAEAFGIESQTRWQVKEYAGNIIPAIATTNAIIAASLVQQALHLLRGTLPSSSSSSLTKTARNIWLKRNSQRIFDVSPLSEPNPHCAVCRVVYAPVRFVPSLTLGEFVSTLMGKGKAVDFNVGEGGEMVSVMECARLVYESEEFEDNVERGMRELGLGEGKFVSVSCEEDEEGGGRWPVVFCVGAYLPETSTERITLLPRADGSPSIPSPIPTRAAPPPPPPAAGEPSSLGTHVIDEDDDELEIILDDELAPQKGKDPLVGAPGSEGAAVVGGARGERKRSAGEAGLQEDKEEGKKSKKVDGEEDDVIVLDD
ncbi:hypothetical protein JCM8547_000600 [Rhodosporidiobolus lusitaniae]